MAIRGSSSLRRRRLQGATSKEETRPSALSPSARAGKGVSFVALERYSHNILCLIFFRTLDA